MLYDVQYVAAEVAGHVPVPTAGQEKEEQETSSFSSSACEAAWRDLPSEDSLDLLPDTEDEPCALMDTAQLSGCPGARQAADDALAAWPGKRAAIAGAQSSTCGERGCAARACGNGCSSGGSMQTRHWAAAPPYMYMEADDGMQAAGAQAAAATALPAGAPAAEVSSSAEASLIRLLMELLLAPPTASPTACRPVERYDPLRLARTPTQRYDPLHAPPARAERYDPLHRPLRC